MDTTGRLRYNKLSIEVQQRIVEDRKAGWSNPYRCDDADIVRRDPKRDKASLWRPAFVRDVEKIMHLPYYNRYTDKTQVFSFFHNDDISRRALHVQLVSRIARNIGSLLGLNNDLIEAIALGHDLGHTPFGHAGEQFLSQIYHNETGRYFNHNVQSARVLDRLFARNISLQTLDGVLCHNGEFERKEYRPDRSKTFDTVDAQMEDCCVRGAEAIDALIPMTLEGCVVRLSDMIAYIGKDRQDARTARLLDPQQQFDAREIGTENAAIINNITVDIIENGYGKDCIMMSENVYNDLKTAKRENYRIIYHSDSINSQYRVVERMFGNVYHKLLDDLKKDCRESVIFRHHVEFIAEKSSNYDTCHDYSREEAHQMVVDYMASMTDDYFIALHAFLFPDSPDRIEYISYFQEERS